MSPRRRKIVKALRLEGRLAAIDGNPRETCPHTDMDRIQWLVGYNSHVVEAPLETLHPTHQKDPMRYHGTW